MSPLMVLLPAHGVRREREAMASSARSAASSAKPVILHAYSTPFTWPISRAGQCRASASDGAMTPVNQTSSPALASSEIFRAFRARA